LIERFKARLVRAARLVSPKGLLSLWVADGQDLLAARFHGAGSAIPAFLFGLTDPLA